MSSVNLPETPAWAGLEPDPAQWRPAAPGARLLCRLLGRRGTLQARPAGRGLRGFYRLQADDAGPDLFLKVVAPDRAAGLLAADGVATALAAAGLAVPHLQGEPLALPDGDRLLVQPLLHGRFARRDAADLAALGTLLATLHRQLATLPQAADIRQASASRDRALLALHDSPAGLSLPGDRAEAVRACLQAGTPQLPTHQAQALHGDLNLGNVLFTEPGGRPVCLDFEDSLHNWHSPAVDLAMALERFVLVRCADDTEALALGRVLLEAYRQAGGELHADADGLVAILQALAVRALLLLSQCLAGGRPVADSEWDKFLWLFGQAARRRPLLARLAAP